MRNIPCESAHHIPKKEHPHIHPAQPRDKRHNGADGTDEPSKKDALTAMSREIPLCALKVARFQKLILRSKKVSSFCAKIVDRRISQYRAYRGKPNQITNVKISLCRKKSGKHHNRCAGHECTDKCKRLEKRDQKNNPVSESAEIIQIR